MGNVASQAPPSHTDLREAIKALEDQLANAPRSVRPYEHAAICYRLGLAYAESPVDSREGNLRKALACFDTAAGIFDPRFDPVEHARVLNAAGAVHRALGDRRKAAGLFEKAGALFEDRERDDERAAALNNLGLVRAELAEIEAAVAAFDTAAELFDTSSPDGRRGRVATLHNRGQAHAALGTEDGLEAALADYEFAQADLDADEAPYHYGLMHHSVGVAFSALANLRPAERNRLLEEGAAAFEESLTVFTRLGFPFQHALAKHNLGLAQAALGAAHGGAGTEQGLLHLRRALASFEDAVALLDTRVHADAWKQAFASLSRVEQDLEAVFPGKTRPAHFAALLATVDDEEMARLLRERLLRLLALPEPRRRSVLAEAAMAVAQLGPQPAGRIMEAELRFLIEQPTESQDVGMRGRFDGHQQLHGEEREEADRALDMAIGEALQGPQRILVRDFFYSIGWERP
jgi:tetratricopeptide (TPR) repeat protein